MGSKLKLVSSKFQLYLVLQNQMINMPMDDCLKGVHFMKSSNSNKHLTLEERKIIEQGIKNGSSKSAIAETLGKDKSTIGKEIKAHRKISHKCPLPLECAAYRHCKLGRACKPSCSKYVPFTCKRRDRTPGACNGCHSIHTCRFNHFVYNPSDAHFDYRMTLVTSREGINYTEEEIIAAGNIIQPEIKRGLSPYAVLQNHPELKMSEKTIYTFIETGIFRNAGIDLIALDLRRQTGRKPMKKKEKNVYKERKDRKYLVGRLYEDFISFTSANINATVVQMDTVYNDVSNGPFMQTFKFLRYSFLIVIYRSEKSSQSMLEGILLESILGTDLFNSEVQVLLTDRGSEFTMAESVETREDGTRRTRIFYCDPMRSNQKGSLENNHEEIRYICPKETDLHALGLTDQNAANLISSHVNSFPKEKLNGKSPFSLLRFLNPAMAQKLIDFGICEIEPDKVTLKPYLLKK